MKKIRIEYKEEQNKHLLIIFLSKSFTNKLVAYLTIQIQINIADEETQLGSFSIEEDFAQDISVIEKLAPRLTYKGALVGTLCSVCAAWYSES